MSTSFTETGPGSAQPAPLSIADPAPLGLAGFAMTTFMLSMFNNGVITGPSGLDFMGIALAYGGFAQLLAGMWEFRKGNTFGATAFSSYGRVLDRGLPHGEVLPRRPDGTGVELLPARLDDFHVLLADRIAEDERCRVHGLPHADDDLFAVLDAGAWRASTSITQAGGDIGVCTAIFAWYASFAGVTNATFKRTVLPVFPLSN